MVIEDNHLRIQLDSRVIHSLTGTSKTLQWHSNENEPHRFASGEDGNEGEDEVDGGKSSIRPIAMHVFILGFVGL